MTSVLTISTLTMSMQIKVALVSRLKISVLHFMRTCSVAVGVLGLHACASSLAPPPTPSVAAFDSVYEKSSVIVKDSVRVEIRLQQRNDTVYRDSIVYVERLVQTNDSTAEEHTDTITLPPQIIEVEKELSYWDDKFMKIGRLASVFLFGLVVYIIIKIKF